MIYQRKEYVQEDRQDERFPVKRIDVLEPVEDKEKSRYVGQVALGVQTPMGVQQIPVSFQIDADSIEQAFDKFEEAAEPKVEEARKQLEEEVRKLRQESSSRIVRPGELDLQGQGGGGNVIDFDKLKGEGQ